jgi:hypothetical protein
MKNGFYFETTEEKATLKTNEFFWTNKRANATDRDHALSIGKEECWTGSYDEDGFHKDFFIHADEIKEL